MIIFPSFATMGVERAFAQSENGCINYDSKFNAIEVSCPHSNLTMIYNSMDDPRILKLEEPGVWLLSASLIIENDSSLSIDASDTAWLKVETPNGIISYGTLLIDSVKISSWDSNISDFVTTDGAVPRPYITKWNKGTGTMNITNSEIGYMGYNSPHKQGISYYSGSGSILDNNNIHDMWYGLYSSEVSFITITHNNIHHNEMYGLDSQAGTHDFLIRNNTVHDIRQGIGIICSLDCINNTVEDNVVYNSKKVGLMFSRSSNNSIVGNVLYNNSVGLSIHDFSSNNRVFKNTIYGNDDGTRISSYSSHNNLYNNTILNSTRYSLLIVDGGYNAGNRIYGNVIRSSSGCGICIFNNSSRNVFEYNVLENASRAIYVAGDNTVNNQFNNNQITNNTYSVLLKNNTSTIFKSNIVRHSSTSDYDLVNSTLNLINTEFSNHKIVGDGTSKIRISNSNPAMISGSSKLIMQIDQKGIKADLRMEDKEIAILETIPFFVKISPPSKAILTSVRYNITSTIPVLQWDAQIDGQNKLTYRIGGIEPETNATISNSDEEVGSVTADSSGYVEFEPIQKSEWASYEVRAQFEQPLGADNEQKDAPIRNEVPISNYYVGDLVNDTGFDQSVLGDEVDYHQSYFGCSYEPLISCSPLANKFKSYSSLGNYTTVIPSLNADVTYVNGKYGKALEMHAERRESIEITNNQTINTNEFSVSFWIKPPIKPEAYAHVISHVSSAKTRGWAIIEQSYIPTSNEQVSNNELERSTLEFDLTAKDGSLTRSPEILLESNRFSHIAITFDGFRIKAYKDGIEVFDVEYIKTYLPDPGIPLKIGSASYSTSTNRWSGTLDDLALFNRPITAQEITEMASSNMPISEMSDKYSGLVAYYPFEGNASDETESGNDGSSSTLLASMVFTPDGRMLFTEKNTGRIMIMKDDRVFEQPFAQISDLYVNWEQGLLGITTDSRFSENHFVYVYYVTIDPDTDTVYNKVVRFTDNNGRGENEVVLLDKIPAVKGYHSGGALAFNPVDEKLYITVGDATEHIFAQDPHIYTGKVLRINRDGTIPNDNPYPNSPVYTLGSRNMFGIAFDNEGYGIITENGEGLYDEINHIQKGANYGFPTVQPANVAPELSDPTAAVWPLRSYAFTYGPTQAIYYTGDKFPELKNKYIFGSFTGQIFVLSIDRDANQVVEELRIGLRNDVYTPVIGMAQSPEGDIYFGSYDIRKLESSGFDYRIERVFPVSVSEPQDVRVKSISVDTKSNTLQMQFSGSIDGRNIGIRIPTRLLEGVYLVTDGNNNTLEYETTPRTGTQGTKYNDIIVHPVNSVAGDSVIIFSGAHVVPEFGSFLPVSLAITFTTMSAIILLWRTGCGIIFPTSR